MPHLHRRAALLAGAALLFPAVAHADEAVQPERSYLPTDIVVTGNGESDYGTQDGSTYRRASAISPRTSWKISRSAS